MRASATFADRIRQLMEDHRLGQDGFAERVGVSQGTVSRWLSGTDPQLAAATAVADRFGVNLTWLATGKGKREAEAGDDAGYVAGVRDGISALREEIDRAADAAVARVVPTSIAAGGDALARAAATAAVAKHLQRQQRAQSNPSRKKQSGNQ